MCISSAFRLKAEVALHTVCPMLAFHFLLIFDNAKQLEMVIEEPHCRGAGDHLMGGGWDPSSQLYYLLHSYKQYLAMSQTHGQFDICYLVYASIAILAVYSIWCSSRFFAFLPLKLQPWTSSLEIGSWCLPCYWAA